MSSAATADISKLKYLHVYVDRTGKRRCYVRRKHGRRIALKSELGTPRFIQEYWTAIRAPTTPVVKAKPKPARAPKPDAPGAMVYFIKGGSKIKIGTTTKVRERISEMQVGSPMRLVLLLTIPGGESIERQYHERFAAHHSHGEWFHAAPEITDFVIRERTKRRQKVG